MVSVFLINIIKFCNRYLADTVNPWQMSRCLCEFYSNFFSENNVGFLMWLCNQNILFLTPWILMLNYQRVAQIMGIRLTRVATLTGVWLVGQAHKITCLW